MIRSTDNTLSDAINLLQQPYHDRLTLLAPLTILDAQGVNVSAEQRIVNMLNWTYCFELSSLCAGTTCIACGVLSSISIPCCSTVTTAGWWCCFTGMGTHCIRTFTEEKKIKAVANSLLAKADQIIQQV